MDTIILILEIISAISVVYALYKLDQYFKKTPPSD